MSVWGMPGFRSEYSFLFRLTMEEVGVGLRFSCRFKTIAGLVKETKESTKDAVQTLCKT